METAPADVMCLERPDGVHIAFERHRVGAARAVVVTHGIFGHRGMGELVTLREALLAAGWDVVLWDVRGHGASQGRFSFGRHEWQDLLALVDTVRSDYSGVSCIGFSFGAFHSILAEADTPTFERMVLVAGPKNFRGLHTALFGGHFFVTLRHRARRPIQRVRLGTPFRTRTFPIDVVGRVTPPTLWVHGTRDWIVPAAHTVALHEAAPDPKDLAILQGGLHAEYLLAQMPDEFLATVVPWLGGGT